MSDFPIPEVPAPAPPAAPLVRFAVVQNGQIIDVRLDAQGTTGDGLRELPANSTAGPGWRWPAGDALPSTPPPDPRLWWVGVGSFKDRLGVDGMAISVSTHPVCVAVREQLYDREFVDLAGSSAAAMLGMLKAAGQPAANAVFAGSGPMTDAKIATILTLPTREAERHIKGLS